MSRNVPFAVRAVPLAVGICAFLTAPAALVALTDGESAELVYIRSISEGWQANRDAFQSLRCRFVRSTGQAETVSAALAGHARLKANEEYLWLVHGTKVMCTMRCLHDLDAELLNAKLAAAGKGSSASGSGGMITLPCLDSAHLENGAYGANHGALLNGLNLFHPGFPDTVGVIVTPFSIGITGGREVLAPGRMFGDAARGRFRSRFLGEAMIDGDTVWKAEVTSLDGSMRWYCELWPDRGFLPRVWDQFALKPAGAEHVFRQSVLEAKKCSNGAWFPMRTRLIKNLHRKPPTIVREVTVQELYTHRPPRDEEFSLTVPADTIVSLPGTKDYFYIGQPRTITADELPAIAAEAKALTIARAARFAAARKLASARTSRWGPRFAALGGLVLIGSFVYLRWRRRQAA